jgi:iron complex outermembrane recepter protein
MKTTLFLRAAACLISTPFAQVLHAEDAKDAEDQTIIVTAALAGDAADIRASQTPGGTDVVHYRDYADKSLVSLRDTLAFSPGVYSQPRYGQEIRISIRGSGLSRGFHMRGLTLLQDGIPINLADDNGDFQELEPIFFDHLEVYRSANALRFGSGTLGGAINGVTPTGQTARGFFARADAGSFDSYRLLLSGGIQRGPGDVWAAISTDGSHGDRSHAARNSLRFHGNAGLNLSDNATTRFYASVNNIDQEIPGALTQAQVLASPKSANAGSIAGDNARDIDSLRLQNRTRFDFGVVKVDAGLFLNAKSLYHPIFQVVDQESLDRGFFARLDYTAEKISLTIGGEARFGKVVSKRFVNVAGKRSTRTFAADQDARTANVYGEIRLKPLESLSLIAGGIYADGMRKQHQTFNSFAGGITDVRGKASFDEFSPKFGVLIDVAPVVQIYGNYSRSAEFPGLIELAQVSSFVPVKSQTAWTAEIGTRGSAGPFSWDLAAYRAQIRGELLQFSTGATIPASTFNADRTLHQGIEASLVIQPASWLRIRQSYQYSDFRFNGDTQYGDNRLPVIPRHAYRAEIRLGNDAMHIAPNVEWIPQGPFADYRNNVRTKGYALTGLTAGARVAGGIDLFADVRNITGKKAVGDISAVIAATPASQIYYPAERRAVFGGVRARFK